MSHYYLTPTSSIRSSFDAARDAVLNRPTPIQPSSVIRPSSFQRYFPSKEQVSLHSPSSPLNPELFTDIRLGLLQNDLPTAPPASLALALWSSSASPADSSSILRAIDSLPLSARPFHLLPSQAPPSRNMYVPTHVKGRGWLSAYHDLAEKRAAEVEKLIAPVIPATTVSGGRYSTRLARPVVVPTPPVPPSPTEEMPLSQVSQPAVRSHKSKAQQRARQAKLRATLAESRSVTPLPAPAPAKRKRAGAGEDIVVVVEHPQEEKEASGPRTSKRRKVVPDMPPPAIVPSRPPPKRTSSKDDGEAFVGQDEGEVSQKKSRPTRKAKEVSSIVDADDEEVAVKGKGVPYGNENNANMDSP